MSFKAKELANLNQDTSLLGPVRLITSSESNPLLLSILEDYKALDEESSPHERAFCSLITAIIQQKKVYFALTRRTLQRIMIQDPNMPDMWKGQAFNTHIWSSILAKFYKDFKCIRQFQKGKGRKSSGFEVIVPEIVQALSLEIDVERQKNNLISFCN